MKRSPLLVVFLVLLALAIIYFLFPKITNSHAEVSPMSPVQEGLDVNDTVVVSAPKALGNSEISIDLSDYRALVSSYFPDVPKMMKIIECESHFNQFKNGKPLMSDTSDVGIMQINHLNYEWAKKLGLDIFNNAVDNVKMGRIIYESQGLKAWMCNK